MRKLMSRLIPLSALVALGCGNSDTTDGIQESTGGSSTVGSIAGAGAFGKGGSGDSTASSSGPSDWVAGDYPPGITEENYLEISDVPGQGDNVRQYKVHIPPSYNPKVPAPLVFCIHGLNQDAVMFCVTGAGMDTLSDQAGFVLVMPNGYQNSWNAGTCCGAASAERLDDVALFRAIFEEVKKHVNVDLNRVYVTGLSNGGFMSYRLACEATDGFDDATQALDCTAQFITCITTDSFNPVKCAEQMTICTQDLGR